MKHKHKKIAHKLFKASLLFKGLDGALETIVAIILFFISPVYLAGILQIFSQSNFIQESQEIILNNLIQIFHGLSISISLFIAVYLLIHGILKIGLVFALLKKKSWAFPLAEIVLGFFVIYQFYKYTNTQSLLLLFLSLFDVLVISLVGFEWREMKEINDKFRLKI